MRRILLTVALVAMGALPAPAAATGQQSINLELGAGVRPGAGGLETPGVAHVAVALHVSRLSIRVRLVDLVTITTQLDTVPASSQYYWDTFSNGQRRCRDSATGQFVRNSLCSTGGNRAKGTYEDRTGAAIEGGVALLRGRPILSLGGGVRVGVEGDHRVDPYGMLYVSMAPVTGNHFYLVGTTGSGMVSGAEIGYSFRLHGG